MKAIISVGNKQYLVKVGDTIDVDLMPAAKSVEFKPLLLASDKETLVGAPELSDHTVTAKIVEEETKSDKVMSIRYKSKKRVHKVRGHRQKHTKIEISSIK